MAQDSGFSTFQSDYDKVNRIDTPTWTKRKVYDDRPYLILPNYKFNMKIGDTKPIFKCFVKKAGEQFGDAITLPNLDTYTITFKVYDYNDNLVFMGPMVASNTDAGELTYVFSSLDFSQAGLYYCEVELTNGSNTFTLPDTHIKYEIIVRD